MHRQHLSERVSRRFRALDRRLGIDHRGRSEWIWAVPILSFAGSFALVAVVGAVVSGVGPELWVPMGLLIAASTAGMSIAYMTPEPDTPGDDRDDGGQHEPTPRTPPILPRSWALWMREKHLPPEPAPPRRRTAEREKSGTRR